MVDGINNNVSSETKKSKVLESIDNKKNGIDKIRNGELKISGVGLTPILNNIFIELSKSYKNNSLKKDTYLSVGGTAEHIPENERTLNLILDYNSKENTNFLNELKEISKKFGYKVDYSYGNRVSIVTDKTLKEINEQYNLINQAKAIG